MVHNLYRFYLYTVFLAMLIFAAIGLGLLLQPLLAFTPLRGSYGASPATAVIVQDSVFFAVSWLIAGKPVTYKRAPGIVPIARRRAGVRSEAFAFSSDESIST